MGILGVHPGRLVHHQYAVVRFEHLRILSDPFYYFYITIFIYYFFDPIILPFLSHVSVSTFGCNPRLPK